MGKSSSRGRRALKKADENDGPKNEVQEERIDEVVEDEKVPKVPFFGLVDSNELTYFKQAESTLNIDAFESNEEKLGFVSSVLEETKSKELKLITNQICSKLMERLILLSNDKQLKEIFSLFQNHFASLAHHKYSSHVLETLLVRVASLIEKELAGTATSVETMDDDLIVHSSMEDLFLQLVEELYPHINTMISHRYASHVLRLIILILAGKEIPSTTMSNSTLRSKKSKIARKMIELGDNEDFSRSFLTPPSFRPCLRKIMDLVAERKDMTALRNLSIDKVASPVIQLAVQVEGLVDKERRIWHLIFLKDSEGKDEKEESFMEYLLSDPVGSHFLEAVIKEGARMKYVERLYRLYMKDRVLKLSRRSTTGVFIIQQLLHKLKTSEIDFMLDQIIPELSSLISITELNNLELAINVIEASIERRNYRREELIQQLFREFAPNFDYTNLGSENPTEILENVLLLEKSTLGNTKGDWPTAEERRRSLFLEKLMQYDYSFVVCVWLAFLSLPIDRFIEMCFHGVFSHVIDKALQISKNGEETKPITILRKRVLNLFQGNIVKLACNAYGSYIVDKLWEFTIFLNMYKDRIATELASDSHKVKESIYGKLVWKNWSMELFLRKKYEWKTLVKHQEEEFLATCEKSGINVRPQKPIDLKIQLLLQNRENSTKRGGEYISADHNKRPKVRGRNR